MQEPSVCPSMTTLADLPSDALRLIWCLVAKGVDEPVGACKGAADAEPGPWAGMRRRMDPACEPPGRAALQALRCTCRALSMQTAPFITAHVARLAAPHSGLLQGFPRPAVLRSLSITVTRRDSTHARLTELLRHAVSLGSLSALTELLLDGFAAQETWQAIQALPLQCALLQRLYIRGAVHPSPADQGPCTAQHTDEHAAAGASTQQPSCPAATALQALAGLPRLSDFRMELPAPQTFADSVPSHAHQSAWTQQGSGWLPAPAVHHPSPSIPNSPAGDLSTFLDLLAPVSSLTRLHLGPLSPLPLPVHPTTLTSPAPSAALTDLKALPSLQDLSIDLTVPHLDPAHTPPLHPTIAALASLCCQGLTRLQLSLTAGPKPRQAERRLLRGVPLGPCDAHALHQLPSLVTLALPGLCASSSTIRVLLSGLHALQDLTLQGLLRNPTPASSTAALSLAGDSPRAPPYRPPLSPAGVTARPGLKRLVLLRGDLPAEVALDMEPQLQLLECLCLGLPGASPREGLQGRGRDAGRACARVSVAATTDTAAATAAVQAAARLLQRCWLPGLLGNDSRSGARVCGGGEELGHNGGWGRVQRRVACRAYGFVDVDLGVVRDGEGGGDGLSAFQAASLVSALSPLGDSLSGLGLCGLSVDRGLVSVIRGSFPALKQLRLAGCSVGQDVWNAMLMLAVRGCEVVAPTGAQSVGWSGF